MNGTLLNGEPVCAPRLLREGDVVQLGGTFFAFLAAKTFQTDPP